MPKKKEKTPPACASCEFDRTLKACFSQTGFGSKGCPTLVEKKLLSKAEKEYEDPQTKEFARQASVQEGECYANRDQQPYVMQPSKTRIIEICEFAHKMGYQRLGLVFCVGLAKEAKVVEKIFKAHGFEVVSVLCKAGRTPKEKIGLREEEKVFRGLPESMCNPIFQAKALNKAGSEFNVLLGLCVGHDSLFFKYAKAPTTVLAVKDRVTGHNPLAAIYLVDTYYRKILYPDVSKG
jgi:uncharacterized metal-binding protein